MLQQVFSQDRIYIDLDCATKDELFVALLRYIQPALPVGLTAERVLAALRAREGQLSTAIGKATALPHAKLPELSQPLGCVLWLNRGLDWQAEDGQPVRLVWLLLSPLLDPTSHLNTLRSLAAASASGQLFQDISLAGSRLAAPLVPAEPTAPPSLPDTALRAAAVGEIWEAIRCADSRILRTSAGPGNAR